MQKLTAPLCMEPNCATQLKRASLKSLTQMVIIEKSSTSKLDGSISHLPTGSICTVALYANNVLSSPWWFCVTLTD